MLSSRQTPDAHGTEKRVIIDDRVQCPICLLDVAALPGRTTMTKHLASHLERLSLDSLPLNTSSWGNENIRDDDDTELSDPDDCVALESHDQPASNEQQAAVEGFEAHPEATQKSLEPEEGFQFMQEEPTLIVKIEHEKRESEAQDSNVHSTPASVPTHEPHDGARIDRLGKNLAEELDEMRLERRMRAVDDERDDAERRRVMEERDREPEYSEHNEYRGWDGFERRRGERRQDTSGLQRSRSTGHAPAPIFNVYNNVYQSQDVDIRADYDEHDTEKQLITDEFEHKQRKTGEKARVEETRLAEGRNRDRRQAEEEERVVGNFRRKKREAEEREVRAWAEFERRRKEKQEKQQKEEEERTKEQQQLDDAMRKRLTGSNFTQPQIDEIMDKEMKRRLAMEKRLANTGFTMSDNTTNASRSLRSHVPVYTKVHVDHMDTETLRYYDIPWEYDPVSKI